MWWGKIIGFFIGHWLGGALGGFIGLLLGHVVDVYRQQPWFSAFHQAGSAVQQMRQTFFEATFQIMGHIAKADGHISEQELDASRHIMQRMGLNEAQRKQAMLLFTQGKQADFNLDATLTKLSQVCRRNIIFLQMFADVQMQAIKLSGGINNEKQKLLNSILQRLGYVPFDFSSFQQGQQRQQYYQPSSRDKLTEAYQLLGVTTSTPDAEIKRIYRRLMSQHHPDKLVAKGLPEEMMKLATEKAQNIQLAYDTIRQARGF